MDQASEQTTAASAAQPAAKRARNNADASKPEQNGPDRTEPAERAQVASTPHERELEDEVQRLRVRLGALESELLETQARTNAVVAEWQERAYWLDRWHLDLNALMRRPGAPELRAAVRAVRPLFRLLRNAKQRLQRSSRES